jgi:hypothetical protein
MKNPWQVRSTVTMAGSLTLMVCQSALKSAPLSASKRDPSGDVVSRPVAA